MSAVDIFVITEGATEREVGLVLLEKGVLSKAGKPNPPGWKSNIGSREGYEQVIQALKEKNPFASVFRPGQPTRVLLIFDQENSTCPAERKDKIEKDLKYNDSSGFWTNVTFSSISGYSNLFEYRKNNLHIILHISSPDNSFSNKDFDGYILQLLQGTRRQEIIQKLLPESQRSNVANLLRKAEQELPRLMEQNGFPWTHAKSWLYAYITVLQYRKSHVWFAKEVVKQAPEEELKNVFGSLIHAWDLLIKGVDS